MEDVFITKIEIENVRHLKGITIDIDEHERKHLIITGKNGSGKTSVLEAMKSYFKHHYEISDTKDFKNDYENLDKLLSHELIGENERKLINQFKMFSGSEAVIDNLRENIELLAKGVDVKLNSSVDFIRSHYVLIYIKSKKDSNVLVPNGVSKINLKGFYSIDERISKYFIQHLVNLKTEASFAQLDGDTEAAQKIEHWFKNFEKSLRLLFDDEGLKLVFDRKEYNFYFKLSNGNTPDINQLSDGYSAILNIVAEIILRMEKKSPMIHDMQGIVLIDEIEAHLHVDLQKKILPFLTGFFPRIQFICTTHSPFVINSDANCVIYDLEKQIRIEDATGYSYDTLIESYFGSDKYSHIVTEKVEEFEVLSSKSDLSDEEKSKLFRLESYFERVPREFAPELDVKLQQIKLKQLKRKTG